MSIATAIIQLDATWKFHVHVKFLWVCYNKITLYGVPVHQPFQSGHQTHRETSSNRIIGLKIVYSILMLPNIHIQSRLVF
jgi:hypothetical protein